MYLQFNKTMELETFEYSQDIGRWGMSRSKTFATGEAHNVTILRAKDRTLDVMFADGAIVFDIRRADVEFWLVNAIACSRILQRVMPWLCDTKSVMDSDTGRIDLAVAQAMSLYNGSRLEPDEWNSLLGSNAKLNAAEARLIAEAPEMYVLLRQIHAGQPVVTREYAGATNG